MRPRLRCPFAPLDRELARVIAAILHLDHPAPREGETVHVGAPGHDRLVLLFSAGDWILTGLSYADTAGRFTLGDVGHEMHPRSVFVAAQAFVSHLSHHPLDQ